MSESKSSELRATIPASPPGRVLVVEDDDQLRRAVARYLRHQQFDVVEAGDGKQALEAFSGRDFDVVLSDIAMPHMDGLALLRAVRERDLDVPVLLVTGQPTVQTAVEALALGALEYLLKPVELAQVGATVQRAVRLGRIARAKRDAIEQLGRSQHGAGDLAGLEATFARCLTSLWMAFQPIVDREGRCTGYEALMRSTEPSLPHPGAVLDAADTLHRLADLGRHVRSLVVAAAAPVPDAGSIFVNLHPQDLFDDSLTDPDGLARIASRIVLEVTERASLLKLGDVRLRVADLRAVGFRIAIDDLGAGYAGLSSFAALEPEVVKLDMSLVRDVDRSTTKQKLVRSMTSLSKELGIVVVAEGVETVGELSCLLELGCDLYQGYLIGKPSKPFVEPVWPQLGAG